MANKRKPSVVIYEVSEQSQQSVDILFMFTDYEKANNMAEKLKSKNKDNIYQVNILAVYKNGDYQYLLNPMLS